MSYVVRVLAIIWGFAWAHVLEHTETGRYWAEQRTWITVVIGVGVTLSLLLPILKREHWLNVFEMFALSSIGIILRSLRHEKDNATAR
jgi:hypothetical protein